MTHMKSYRRFLAPLVRISSNPRHRVNIGTSEAALPMFRRMRPDIADDVRTPAHAKAERLGKAVKRLLR